MRPIRRFLQLPAEQQRLVLASAVGLVAAEAGLHLFPFRLVWKMTRQMGGWIQTAVPTEESELWRRARLVSLQVARAAKYVPGASCLPQALTGYLLLRRHGVQTSLKIGVRRTEKQIEAHAWLELNGQVVLGGRSSPERYRAFEELQRELEAEELFTPPKNRTR